VAGSAARKAIKTAVFLACLIPVGWLTYGALNNALGANPVKAIIHGTGVWTLRLLLLTLLATPLRRLTGWAWPIAVRRMLGLFAFFYAVLHLFTYLLLDQSFDGAAIVHDVIKRPFITVGMLAFALLVPLAATSTNAMVRRLGGNWKRLHRLGYVIPVLGVLHYYWLVKADVRAPLAYGLLVAILLGWRLRYWFAVHRSVAAGRAVEQTGRRPQGPNTAAPNPTGIRAPRRLPQGH